MIHRMIKNRKRWEMRGIVHKEAKIKRVKLAQRAPVQTIQKSEAEVESAILGCCFFFFLFRQTTRTAQ